MLQLSYAFFALSHHINFLWEHHLQTANTEIITSDRPALPALSQEPKRKNLFRKKILQKEPFPFPFRKFSPTKSKSKSWWNMKQMVFGILDTGTTWILPPLKHSAWVLLQSSYREVRKKLFGEGGRRGLNFLMAVLTLSSQISLRKKTIQRELSLGNT